MLRASWVLVKKREGRTGHRLGSCRTEISLLARANLMTTPQLPQLHLPNPGDAWKARARNNTAGYFQPQRRLGLRAASMACCPEPWFPLPWVLPVHTLPMSREAWDQGERLRTTSLRDPEFNWK